jgi:2-polyprenyl-6-methoxyphenol hydroxylase-like FAD-dependent oxidoreductase
MAAQVDVLVVGGGPVGLFLGCRLAQLGVRFAVLERRPEPSTRTRAIGVHPPSLERLAALGLADHLVARGCRVARGRVYSGTRALGCLHLDRAPGPFNYVLTVPQFETEAVLRDQLQRQARDAWRPGAEVRSVVDEGDTLLVRGMQSGDPAEWRAALVVGCDGKDSLVRSAARIEWRGAPYAAAFVMGDFADGPAWGEEARIVFHARGFVESFPLPGSLRRWVAHWPTAGEVPGPDEFEHAVAQWTGVAPGRAVSRLTAFGVQHYLAAPFAAGRTLLAGDAAHVMSPIGGQGMNVGWMDAWDAAEAIRRVLRDPSARSTILAAYSRQSLRRAARAIRRAGRNLAIGLRPLGGLRDALVALALRGPGQAPWARYFTMRGL